MERKVLVSIIIAVYNTEKYLDRCLESITNQTLKDIEIICINDASQDHSLQKLLDWEKKDPRVTVVNCEKNMKQGHARNIGIRMAKGAYIGVIDSDDFIELNMYEMLINHSDNQTTDLVVSNGLKRFKDGKVLKETRFLNNISTTEDVKCEVAANGGPMVTNIIRRQYFIDNNMFYPENLIYEDNANGPIIYLKANKINVVDQSFYYYCVNPTSTVNKKNQPRYFDRTITAKIFYERARKEDFYEIYKEELDFYFYKIYLYNTIRGALSTFSSFPTREIKAVLKEYKQLCGNAVLGNDYFISEKRNLLGRLVNFICFHPQYLFVMKPIHIITRTIKDLRR